MLVLGVKTQGIQDNYLQILAHHPKATATGPDKLQAEVGEKLMVEEAIVATTTGKRVRQEIIMAVEATRVLTTTVKTWTRIMEQLK